MTLARVQRIEQILNLMEFTLARGLLDQKARTCVNEKPEFVGLIGHLQAILLSVK
jgi:hypothetical protein